MKNESIKLIDTRKIFENNKKSIKIIHNGMIYILRITKDNKLILTK